jgi:hypothetical protein
MDITSPPVTETRTDLDITFLGGTTIQFTLRPTDTFTAYDTAIHIELAGEHIEVERRNMLYYSLRHRVVVIQAPKPTPNAPDHPATS